MTSIESAIVGIVVVLAITAAMGALYTAIKVFGVLNNFHLSFMTFMKESDDRYVRTKDQDRVATVQQELEATYRAVTRDKIEDIEVEIRKDKDDLTIKLNGILAAIKDSQRK